MTALLGLPDGDDCSWFGQLFIMALYGYMLYQGAVYIGEGSEKLLLVYGPGIVGGLLIPILGAIPDAAIVLVSGLGSRAKARCQVSTGVGTLAGSTIMLLTIPWAFSLFAGRRDIDPISKVAASDANGRPKCSKGFSPFKQCVTTYANTISSAKIMICTSISYLIVLIPAIIEKHARRKKQIKIEHYPALIGFIVCVIAFIAYSLFQLIDSNRNTVVEMEQTKLKFLQWKESVDNRVTSTEIAIKTVFNKFDKDGNGLIDIEELHLGFKELGLKMDRAQVMELMRDSQQDDDLETMSFKEFSDAVKTWSLPILQQRTNMCQKQLARNVKGVIMIDEYDNRNEFDDDNSLLLTKDEKQSVHKKTDEEEYEMMSDIKDEEKQQLLQDLWKDLNMETEMEEEKDENEKEEEELIDLCECIRFFVPNWLECICIGQCIITKNLFIGICELIFGTFLCCIFSDPMVSVIGIFSNTLGISSFFVSFIVTPIASNAAEIYASLLFARKKTKEGISMGFTALYGAACMNNTFVLCIFCALVFFRELQWTFIAETLVILLTVIVVGINGMKQTVFVWQGFIVISLFPLSLLLVALLDPLLDDVTKCPYQN